jgi:hypothetical protein
MPRLDYSGSCPALLLEPQRTNKFLYSEYYGSGGLEIYATGTHTYSVTNNYAVSPEGVQNAIRFVADITSASSRVVLRDGVSCGGGNHTLTFYAKSNTTETYTMGMHFDGSNKKQIQVTPEWQRFEYGESANSVCNAGIECRSDGGYSSSVDVSVYGFQLEENLYPTSYIPTYGSSVTRTDEFFYNYDDLQNNGILGSTWTFMYDQTYQDVARDAACAIFLLDNGNSGGDGQTNVRIALQTNGSFRLQDSDGTQLATSGNKILCRYDGSKISWYIDGSLFNEHNVTGAFDTLNRHNPSGSNKKTIRANQVVIFPTALTDSECIALTTI